MLWERRPETRAYWLAHPDPPNHPPPPNRRRRAAPPRVSPAVAGFPPSPATPSPAAPPPAADDADPDADCPSCFWKLAAAIADNHPATRLRSAKWYDKPLTMKAFADALKRYAVDADPTPPVGYTFSGRGVVTCGGGRYRHMALLSVVMARRAGYEGPFLVAYDARAEEKPDVKAFAAYGADVVDVSRSLRAIPQPVGPGGWEHKAVAVAACLFDDVLFLDADAYLVADPAPLFALLDAHPAVFWHDPWHADDMWAKIGLPPLYPRAVNGGQWLVRKSKCWRALRTYGWMNARSDYFYKKVFGDQDCQLAAWRLTQTAFHVPGATDTAATDGRVLVCNGPDGAPAVVHRCRSKFDPLGEFPNQRRYAGPVDGVPFEAETAEAFRAVIAGIEGGMGRP
jgi:hypothetical protein